MDLRIALERKRQQLQEAMIRLDLLKEQIAALVAESEEVQAQIKALEDVEREFASNPHEDEVPSKSARRPKRRRPERKQKSEGTTLIDAIRQIAQELPQPFSTKQLREVLAERYPDLYNKTHFSSHSGTLRRLSIDGGLEVVEQGGPGKEATYRVPGSEEQPRPEGRADKQLTVFEGAA